MEQWFNPQTAGTLGGIIGAALGSTGALIGCSCNICVRKGWKKFMYTIFTLAITASIVLLATGIIALCIKQPRHVWYSFLLPGVVGNLVFWGILPSVSKRFTQSEIIKMQAKDL